MADGSATKHKGLKDLARHRLGAEMTEILDLIGRGKAQVTFAEVPIDVAAPYGAADADMTLRLVPLLQQELRKGLLELLDMEMKSAAGDPPTWNAGGAHRRRLLPPYVPRHERGAAQTGGGDHLRDRRGAFNINSTQQLSDILFEAACRAKG